MRPGIAAVLGMASKQAKGGQNNWSSKGYLNLRVDLNTFFLGGACLYGDPEHKRELETLKAPCMKKYFSRLRYICYL